MMLGAFVTVVSLAVSAAEVAPDIGWVFNVNGAGVALDGYDVMGFHEGVSERGDPSIFTDLEGVRYWFASPERRAQFIADPDRYEPVCGGWDAVMCGVDPERAGFAPNRWRPSAGTFQIHDGRLLLLSDRLQWNTMDAFSRSEDPDGVIERADEFWSERLGLAGKMGFPPKGMNPAARLELAEWAPLMGTWRCEAFGLSQSGDYRANGTADWTFKFSYDGYVIQDDWRPHENPSASGPAFRIYDPMAKKWGMVFMPSVGPTTAWWLMTGEWDESELHGEYESQEGKTRGRLRFYEIKDESFRWISDRSTDGGETWVEKVSRTECRRIAR